MDIDCQLSTPGRNLKAPFPPRSSLFKDRSTLWDDIQQNTVCSPLSGLRSTVSNASQLRMCATEPHQKDFSWVARIVHESSTSGRLTRLAVYNRLTTKSIFVKLCTQLFIVQLQSLLDIVTNTLRQNLDVVTILPLNFLPGHNGSLSVITSCQLSDIATLLLWVPR